MNGGIGSSKVRLLNKVGRLRLAKLVISSIPIYTMQLMAPSQAGILLIVDWEMVFLSKS